MMDFTKQRKNSNLFQDLSQNEMMAPFPLPDLNQYRPPEPNQNPAMMHEKNHTLQTKPQMGLFKDILSGVGQGVSQAETPGEAVGGALGGLVMTFLNRKFNKNK